MDKDGIETGKDHNKNSDFEFEGEYLNRKIK